MPSSPTSAGLARYRLQPVWAIALHTIREAVRKKTLVVIGLFSLVLLLSAPFWPSTDPAGRIKLVGRLCLGGMAFLTSLVLIFVAAPSLPEDIESKRIYYVTTKPLPRLSLLAGKLLGFLLLAAAILIGMALVSGFSIRMATRSSQVLVTAPDVEVTRRGRPVATIPRGIRLTILDEQPERYLVQLPEAQRWGTAWVSADQVTLSANSRRVATKGETTELLGPGGRSLTARGTCHFRIEDDKTEGGKKWFLVRLPLDLRIDSGWVPSEAVTRPTGGGLSLQRPLLPIRTDRYRTGQASRRRSPEGQSQLRLDLGRFFLAPGETYRFPEIPPEALPAGRTVKGWIRFAGITGKVHRDREAQAEEAQAPSAIKLTVEFTHPKTDLTVRKELLATQTATLRLVAKTGEETVRPAYAAGFELPREILRERYVEMRLLQTDPAFEVRGPDFLEGERALITWHFPRLSPADFGPGRVDAQVEFLLRRGPYTVPGEERCPLAVRAENPGTGFHEDLTVMIASDIPARFSFDRRCLFDPARPNDEGRVLLRIRETPKELRLGLRPNQVPLKLLRQPVAFESGLAKAVILIGCQVAILTAYCLLGSTFLSAPVATFGGLAIYLFGSIIGLVRQSLTVTAHHHGPAPVTTAWGHFWAGAKEFLVDALGIIVPNFSRFSASELIAQGVTVPSDLVWRRLGEAGLYGLAGFVLAFLIFRRRELAL